MEKPACDFMEDWPVDIKDVSAADLLETKGHLLLKKALGKIVLESHHVEIVDLADDSESQKVLNDICWICLLTNHKHINKLSSDCSKELHKSYCELRYFSACISSTIKREAH